MTRFGLRWVCPHDAAVLRPTDEMRAHVQAEHADCERCAAELLLLERVGPETVGWTAAARRRLEHVAARWFAPRHAA